jgi:rRNA maturation protein Nop10
MRKCIYCNKYNLTSFITCPHCGDVGDVSNKPPVEKVTKNYPFEKCRLCDISGWKGGINCLPCKNKEL